MTVDKNLQFLPAFILQNLDAVIYYHAGKPITRDQLLNHALQISQQLPNHDYALNLCKNRYLFVVAFIAVYLKKQINLLPSTASSRIVGNLIKQYPDSYCLVDTKVSFPGKQYRIPTKIPAFNEEQFPFFNPNAIASISFTSGSTGEPKAIPKSWREFQQSALLATQRLGLDKTALTILSTVPPQHMYGLETSLFWPLYSNANISSARPFFPEDVRRLIFDSEQPCILLSSPTHIKSFVKGNLEWKNIAKIISSTAPLSSDLVIAAEQSFKAPLFEIFGSTETMSFASRRPIKNNLWSPYQGIKLARHQNQFLISGGHLSQTVVLDDQFAVQSNGQFKIIGRSTDMVKIAGKRASLSELNRIINAIPDVKDAVFYRTATERLGAFVVSQLPKKHIIATLKKSIDVVFIPRPLILVKQLPRNDIGKILNSNIQQMIQTYDVA